MLAQSALDAQLPAATSHSPVVELHVSLLLQVTLAQRLVEFGRIQVPHDALQVCPLGQSVSEEHFVDAPPDLVKGLFELLHAKSITDSMDNVAVNLNRLFIT